MLLYRPSKIDMSAEIRLCIDFLRRLRFLWSNTDTLWFGQSVSSANFTGFTITSTGHTDGSTGVGSTFASAAESQGTCREADVSRSTEPGPRDHCRALRTRAGWLPAAGSKVKRCSCRVAASPAAGVTPRDGDDRPHRTSLQQHMLPVVRRLEPLQR